MPSAPELHHLPTASPWVPAPPPWRTGGVAALVDHARPAGNVHDRASRATLLTRIAAVLDQPLLDPMDVEQASLATALLVPGEALDARVASAAGIVSRHGLLGGVVPAPFVATKAISHGLVDEQAACPAGWSFAMSHLLGDAALPGYTAFTPADAAKAGRLLLAKGPVRIKDVCGKAGLGQQVVRSTEQLDAALARENAEDLAEHGIVLEENLTDVITYSVGMVELGHQCVSYWGTQTLTTDHKGREVYGGTDLHVVRGGFAELAALDLPDRLVQAIRCAAIFDTAAHAAYPDILLTRRNYDVIEGTDAAGIRRIGVLEQSWRVGGASGAEIAALEAFRAEPDTTKVRCSTVEVYDLVTPPVGAVIYYQGVDPVVGTMTKYAMRYA